MAAASLSFCVVGSEAMPDWDRPHYPLALVRASRAKRQHLLAHMGIASKGVPGEASLYHS